MRNVNRRGPCCAIALAVAVALATHCGGSASGNGDTTPECKPAAQTSCPTPVLHYSDVKPIFQQRCYGCHYENAVQWPLTTYEHVASWYDVIPNMLLTCQMPPPDAGIPMTNEERNQILSWLHCGFPE